MNKPDPQGNVQEFMKKVFMLWGKIGMDSTTVRTANHTAGREHFIPVNTTGGGIVITLPPVAQSEGRLYFIFKTVAANQITIQGDANINGAASITMANQYSCRGILASNGVWWVIVSI